jgi:hypothetical protein
MSISAVLTGVAIDTLVPILAKSGVPLLISAIKSKSPLAGRVIEKIAEALGVPPTAEAIVERFDAAPDATTAAIKQVEVDNSQMWQTIAETSGHVNKTMRAEYGEQPLLIQRLWRPVFAYVYTAVFGGLCGSIITLIWRGDVVTINSLIGVSGLLITLMGMGAAVLGVYTYQRSQEKIEGVD